MQLSALFFALNLFHYQYVSSIYCKKSVLKIQEYIHEGVNLKFYIPEFFNFKLLIPEYSPV
jgi:hypothetical protein